LVFQKTLPVDAKVHAAGSIFSILTRKGTKREEGILMPLIVKEYNPIFY